LSGSKNPTPDTVYGVGVKPHGTGAVHRCAVVFRNNRNGAKPFADLVFASTSKLKRYSLKEGQAVGLAPFSLRQLLACLCALNNEAD